MGETGNKVTIIVALISLIASIGVALISNWEKFAPSGTAHSVTRQIPTSESSEPVVRQALPETRFQGPPPVSKQPVQTAVIPVAGVWIDRADPQLSNSIEQSGNTLTFYRNGYLDNGVWFESYGIGEMGGSSVNLQYSASYSTGGISTGQCGGTVSTQGTRMDLNCRDSLLGSFPVNLTR